MRAALLWGLKWLRQCLEGHLPAFPPGVRTSALHWAPAWSLTQLRVPKPPGWKGLGRATESRKWKGTGHVPSTDAHRPSSLVGRAFVHTFVTPRAPLVSLSILWNLLPRALPPAAVFAFTDSPLGPRGQPAWTSAGHPRPSWSGLHSGTESLLGSATHPLLLLCPPWCWAGCVWGRPNSRVNPTHLCWAKGGRCNRVSFLCYDYHMW